MPSSARPTASSRGPREARRPRGAGVPRTAGSRERGDASARVDDRRRGPRGGATYAGGPIDGVDALYVPAGIPPGGRVPVAYLLTGRGNPVTAARRLGVAAAGDELSWQRTTAPFAVVVTSAHGPRTLGAAMRFAQTMLPLSQVPARRAVIGVGSEAAPAAAARVAASPAPGHGHRDRRAHPWRAGARGRARGARSPRARVSPLAADRSGATALLAAPAARRAGLRLRARRCRPCEPLRRRRSRPTAGCASPPDPMAAPSGRA